MAGITPCHALRANCPLARTRRRLSWRPQSGSAIRRLKSASRLTGPMSCRQPNRAGSWPSPWKSPASRCSCCSWQLAARTWTGGAPREPMFVLLVAAGSVYLVMGQLADALMLLGFVFVVMGITIVQERRTERALGALRDLSSPRAIAVRGGRKLRIAGREVVRGDVVLVAEGDRIPADAILRRGMNLSVDESLLTGESVPVRKRASVAAQELQRPGGDDLRSLF